LIAFYEKLYIFLKCRKVELQLGKNQKVIQKLIKS